MMKHPLMFSLALACILFSPCSAVWAADDLPLAIAGIELGEDIEDYAYACQTGTAVPLRDEMYISEVDIDTAHFPGVRGGTIGYGNCDAPGTIVRIKLKFKDRSERLFERMLKHYDRTLGTRRTWQGDAFHIVKSWKWEFTDDDGKLVEILLSHSRDPEYRPGVSVKMTLRSQYLRELQCWRDGHPARLKRHHHNALDIPFYTPKVP